MDLWTVTVKWLKYWITVKPKQTNKINFERTVQKEDFWEHIVGNVEMENWRKCL